MDMDLRRAVSTTTLEDKNVVIVRVAFPEFGVIKSVRCAKHLPIGEIKSYFHAQFKFEDDLYALFIPAVDSRGVLSFADGKWCDDGKLAQEYNIQPMEKIILAKRIPTSTGPSQPTPVSEAKKNRRLSRRILGFFSPSDGKSASSRQLQQPQQQPAAAPAVQPAEVNEAKFASSAEEEEFLKFANSFAQRAGKQAAAEGQPMPVIAAPVVPASNGPRSPALPKTYSAGPSMLRQRRMTFDTKNIGSLLSMEKESNPVFRRQQLVRFLSDFLDTRVSLDELISSGIITVDPPPALCDSPVNISFVKEMFEWILAHGMIEGIFRISGPSQDVDSMTDILNKGLLFDFNAELNPHLVASVLKKYIRDRPFATVPYRCYRSAILKHDSLPDKYAPFSVEECKAFIDSLPDDKPDLFRLVVCYLKKVSAFKEQTKMSDSNLAIVWAPVLMRCRGDGLSLFSESDRQTDFLTRMIEVIDDIIVKEESSADILGSSQDERTPEKQKRHKHHHKHHHHRHGHSQTRSSRRKSESANSSPALSPVLPPSSSDFLPLSRASEPTKRRAPPIDVTSSQRINDSPVQHNNDTPSSTTESPSSTVEPKDLLLVQPDAAKLSQPELTNDTPIEKNDSSPEKSDPVSTEQNEGTPAGQSETPTDQNDAPTGQSDAPTGQNDAPTGQNDAPDEQKDTPTENNDAPQPSTTE